MARVWQYQILAEPVLPREETTLVSKWFQPASEPVRVSRGVALTAALVASGAVFVGEPSDIFDPSAAAFPYVQASEPVRAKPPLPVGGPQFSFDPLPIPDAVAFDPATFPHLQAAEPVRVRAPLPVGGPQFVIDPDALTQPETTLVAKWFQPASEPVRARAPLPVGGPQFKFDPLPLTDAFDPATFPHIAPPDVVRPAPYTWVYSAEGKPVLRPLVTMWFQPASEPVRVRAPLPVGGPQFVTDPLPVVVPFDPAALTHIQASEPVRGRPPLPVGAPYFITDVLGLTEPEATQLDKWYQPASEPVRLKPINPAALVGGSFETVDILPTAAIPPLWTPKTPASTSWAEKSGESTTWTPKTPESTTWT